MTQPSPKVSIIILNYNNYEDTAECLRSLESVDYGNFDIWVVDNGSPDGSGEQLEDNFDSPRFILNEQNLGFAGGNRVAIERILQEGTDYILLLNNDMVPQNDFLSPLVSTAEEHDRVALVGGLIPYHDADTDEYWYAGGTISPWRVELSTETQPADDESPFETGYISGALMLISADFAREHNILREEYYFGRDQLDISWRAKQNGWKLMVNSSAVVSHKASATVGEHWSPFKAYHDTWGRLFFAVNQLPIHYRLAFTLFFTASRPLVYAEWLRGGRPDTVKAQLLAIADFLRGIRPSRDLSLE